MREREVETKTGGCNEIDRRDERGEDFLKLHFVAPERPYTGISTPTARDNEASTGAPFMEGVGEDTRRKKEEKEQKEKKDHRDRTGINDLPKLWQRPPKRRQSVLYLYHSSSNPFLR
ncbi:hypothetical protein G5I_10770 [Acromyrmex echinatior]|uniref:Uncharacterized protein n=1 Tax=Acromyrmex echinatior TaxID=103372 RepID=F4WXT0_ACREC|nr:hypothetical protein G5I_10770 [Acromyrmex echinatior]